MKVYFTASIAGKKDYLAQYQTIIQGLKQLGCEVTADHILDHTESQIRLETKDERLKFHQKLEKWITGCDCAVVEGTFPSISVGYEVSMALHRNKPVLLLYTEGEPPSLLSNCHEDKIVCEKYDLEGVKDILEGFLNYVTGKTDTRFTFYLTSAQMAHLDTAAQEKREPKAVYWRQLIEKDMAGE